MKYFIIFIALIALNLHATDMIIHKTNGDEMMVSIEEIDQITFAEYSEVTSEGMTFKWRTDENYIYAKIIAPGTGWVAVGFDPEMQMQGADIVIGYVTETETMARDDYANAPTAHQSDEALGGTNDLMMVTGTEMDGMTELTFKKPLNSGDMYDKELMPGNTYVVMLAYGPQDNYTSYHTARTIVEIEL